MELLEPGGVAHVGLLAGHAFHIAGVDEVDLEAGVFEQRGEALKVRTCGAGHGGDEFLAPMVFALALAHGVWLVGPYDGAAAEHNE